MQKPSNPKGTRDFGPVAVRRRTYIINTIKSVFELYGFEPIETPAFENLTTLTGKYGQEGSQLLFKILNSGDITTSIQVADVEGGNNNAIIQAISKKGLRYDLTVPFARYVVQNTNEITFPFKRYQIQPVWRADRPAKGRYQEFYQCDVDIIGSKSVLSEAEIIQIYQAVFNKLELGKTVLKLNHRKLLEAMVEKYELNFPVNEFSSTLDKLDKIGRDKVIEEMVVKGANRNKCETMFEIIHPYAFNTTSLQDLRTQFQGNTKADEALDDLEEICSYIKLQEPNLLISLDLSLARGLDYYTGCIFEAEVENSGIGSISGGGRYDNLTGVFGLKDVSGVGISFGIDRIYDILLNTNAFPTDIEDNNQIMFCHFDQKSRTYCFHLAEKLRKAGLPCIVFPDLKNLSKQMDYANKKKILYTVVVGDNEMDSGQLSIKQMVTGEKLSMTIDEFIKNCK